MARRRFFVDSVRGGRAELKGEAAEHLRRVLRAEPGQRYELSDNQFVYLAEIEGFRKDAVSFRVLERLPSEAPAVRLVLLASLIKFDRFEWIVEKATELGVETLIPVVAARSERGLERAAAKRLERWRKIALESSQQARRTRLPEICPSVSFEDALLAGGLHRYLLEEERGAPALASALEGVDRKASSDVVSLLAGPEGGWTAEERREATARGWQPVSLGPWVLRSETAVIAALAILGNAWYACVRVRHQ